MTDVTQILSQIEHGDPRAAEQLLPLVYHELRKLAAAKLANEKPGQTLQATALVHEAYLRLVSKESDSSWNSRGHFFGAAAEAMRRILVDQARRKASRKAGADYRQLSLSDADPEVSGKSIDLIALDEALNRLEEHDSRSFHVVRLRYFGGLTIQETALALQVSESTVENDWAYAKSWIKRQLR
jgi:RNA polymerase sigma factor (TIGR02999 family)